MLNISGKTASSAPARLASFRSSVCTLEVRGDLRQLSRHLHRGDQHLHKRSTPFRETAVLSALRAKPCRPLRAGHSLGQKERGQAVIDLLAGLDESSPAEQVANPAGRGVQDVPLHAGDTDVVDEPSPEAIATAVDQEQPPAGFRAPGASRRRHLPGADSGGNCWRTSPRRRHRLRRAGRSLSPWTAATCSGSDRRRGLALDQHRRDEVDPPDR